MKKKSIKAQFSPSQKLTFTVCSSVVDLSRKQTGITIMELENKSDDHLPEEIIREILLRVPVKSLLRFRCVSKPWLSLISSYKFAKAHLKLSTPASNKDKQQLMYGFKTQYRTMYYLHPSYRTLPKGLYSCSVTSIFEEDGTNNNNNLLSSGRLDCPFGREISLVGSCNGLVCVEFSLRDHTRAVSLWNPTTRKRKMLPHLSFTYFQISDYSFGFGYDELHDDYKVVRYIHCSSRMSEQEVKVYSLRTNSWKTLSSWPAAGGGGGEISSCRLPGKFLNGFIHWLLRSFGRKIIMSIVSLDLATDTFAQMPLPVGDDYEKAEVGIVGGCLAVYCKCRNGVDIWVMKEYGVSESWTRVVQIPFRIEDPRVDGFLYPRPLFFSADGRYILMDYINVSSFWIYDSHNPQVLHQFNKKSIVGATTYVESLVSLALDGEEEEEEERDPT